VSIGQKDRVIKSALPEGEQRDLTWFFGKGQTAFERSTFGDSLQRCELFTFGSKICETCDGSGFPGNTDESLKKAIAAVEDWQERRGKTFAAELREYQMVHGKRAYPKWYDDGTCKSCRGSGWVPRRDRMRLSRIAWCHKCGEPDVEPTQRVCPNCGGKWTVRAAKVSARPSGNEVHLLAEPYGDDLERYGSVSKRLSTLAPDYADTMRGFFGAGQRWADDRKLGHIVGVMPLTLAGRDLLEESREKTKNESKLPDDYVIATEIEMQFIQPKKTRGGLIDTARDQAESLLRDAEKEWRFDEDDDAPKPDEKPKPRRPERLKARDLRLVGAMRELRIIEIRMAARP
jgi:hypothetical protein